MISISISPNSEIEPHDPSYKTRELTLLRFLSYTCAFESESDADGPLLRRIYTAAGCCCDSKGCSAGGGGCGRLGDNDGWRKKRDAGRVGRSGFADGFEEEVPNKKWQIRWGILGIWDLGVKS